MNRKSFLFLFVALLWQSGIFSQNNPLLRYIPEDVTTVIHFDIKRMGGKIPAETFRQSVIYRQMMKDPDMPWNSLLTEPEKLGIDLSAGLILAMKYQGADRHGEAKPALYLFFKLKDATIFTENITKLFWDKEQGEKNEELFKVYGTDRIMTSEGSMAAGWNNDIFVMTTGYSEEMAAELERYHNSYPVVVDTAVVMFDTVAWVDSNPPPPFDYEGMRERFKKSQRETCFQLLTPKSSGALTSNIHFANAMNSEADIKFWVGSGGNPITGKMMPFARLFEKAETFSGKNAVVLLNFENGRVIAKASNYPEGLVADVYKKYPPSVQNMELVKRLPAGVLLGLANISFNQQMAGELLQKSGLLQILDSLKSKIPFDLSLLPGTFKSHIMVAALKSDLTTTMDHMTAMNNGLQVIIALPIADKAKFEKLKAAVPNLLDSLKGFKKEMEKGPDLFARHNDEMLVIAYSPQTAEDFLNNKGAGTIPAWMTEYSKFPMLLNINLREIIGNMDANDFPERKRNKGMNQVLAQLFDQVLIYGGGYENGSVNSVFEFRFSNQNENSLKQLFNIVTSMAERDELRMREESYVPGNTVTDTAVVVEEVTLVDIQQEEEKVEPPPPPPAKIDPPKISIPIFKDAEVQAYAKEYAALVAGYMTAFQTKDMEGLAALAEKSIHIGEKSQAIAAKLANDPEESKKFTDWVTGISKQMEDMLKEVTPAASKSPAIEIPTFTNPEAKAFAKEYAAFISEYIAVYKKNDTKKLAALDVKGEAFEKRAGLISAKLANDPKQSKKFNDWVDKVNGQVAELFEDGETPPPPPKTDPPKVEMKKFTPPAIRKDD